MYVSPKTDCKHVDIKNFVSIEDFKNLYGINDALTSILNRFFKILWKLYRTKGKLVLPYLWKVFLQ